jgi:putative phosphoesterase
MLVGLIADTHDRLPAIDALLREMMARGAHLVLHAGDYCAPFALRPFLEHNLAMAGVFGKNDGDQEGLRAAAAAGMGIELFESPHSMEVAGQHILIVHDLGDVREASIANHSIVVHGFTHREEMKTRGDALVVNPGEGCGWLYGDPSAAVIDLDTRMVEFFKVPGDR